ncbi:MAG: cupin domain-containing protein [Planctomycetales bacterium]
MSIAMDELLLDLRGDVEYQPGGIVSRILLKQPIGSVTAFAFDAGQELSEHTCPYDALLHVVDGTGIVTVGESTFEVESGQIIRLPAHVPHSVKAERRFKMLLTMLRAAAS